MTYSMDHRPAELDMVPVITKSHTSREFFEFAALRAPTTTWAEFGIGVGGSTRKLLRLCNGILYAFDSFEGIPDPWKLSERMTEPVGRWRYNRSHVRDLWLRHDIEIIDGLFADTLPFQFPEQIGLINIDCDVYSSTRDVLFGCDPWLREGSVLVFDELYGYECFADHEYRALCEWREATGKSVEWIGRARFQAAGIVHV